MICSTCGKDILTTDGVCHDCLNRQNITQDSSSDPFSYKTQSIQKQFDYEIERKKIYSQAIKEVRETWVCKRCKYFDSFFGGHEADGFCNRVKGYNPMVIWKLPMGCTYFEPKEGI